MSSIFSVTMAIALPECVSWNCFTKTREMLQQLFVKLNIERSYAMECLHNVWETWFEKTGSLCIQLDRQWKPISKEVLSEVAMAIIEQLSMNDDNISKTHTVSWELEVWKCKNILRKVVHFFSYNISHNQQLLVTYNEHWLFFALTIFAWVDVDS